MRRGPAKMIDNITSDDQSNPSLVDSLNILPDRTFNDRLESPSSDIRTLFSYDFNPSETFPEMFLPRSDLSVETWIVEEIASSSAGGFNPSTIDDVCRYLKDGIESNRHRNPSSPSRNMLTDDNQLELLDADPQCLPVTRSQTETCLSPRNSNAEKDAFLRFSAPFSPIALSPSVAITSVHPKQLALVHPLEETYRPRYKSDYFPQTGPPRKPRYIADILGNHYLTLKIPRDYLDDLEDKYIRIALITVCSEQHGHYYSPSKFQRDNDDIRVPDENPLYLPVTVNHDDRSTMKLQLVLIKFKSAQLYDLQPLKCFSDGMTDIQNLIHDEKLTPKELINRYQLNRSQIAFTICSQRPDGPYEPHPESTLTSSVLTEVSTPKKSNEATYSSTVRIRCPYCLNYFQRDLRDEEEEDNERALNSTASSSDSRTITSDDTTTPKRKRIPTSEKCRKTH